MSRRNVLLPLAIAAITIAGCGGSTPSVAPPILMSTAPTPTVAPASQVPTPTPAASTQPFGVGLVEIDAGRRVSVSCYGTPTAGQPTVLLEHGLGGGASSWYGVQQALADTVRSCAYDRAGLGRSDIALGGPRTAADLTDDLESVLQAIGEPGPYVVVSHSLGAWVAALFVDRRPTDVVGLVFVDPRSHRVTERHREAMPAPDDDEDPVVTDVRAFMDDPAFGFDANEERVTYAASEDQVASVLDTDGPAFGERPVVVLQAEGTIDEFPPLPPPILEAWWQVWVDEQLALAEESTAGSLRSVASGHDMPREAPDAVVQAILEVIAAAR